MTDQTASIIEMDHNEKHRMYIGSFWIFVFAEAMIFITIFSTRFLLAGTLVSSELNQVDGIISTLLMILSIWTLNKALTYTKQGNHQKSANQLYTTAILAFIVFVLNGYEWVTSSLDWASRFGEVYYITTLFHELHIFGGVLALVAMAIQASKGRFTEKNYWPVKAMHIYWLFVIFIWLCVYVLFYLI